MRSLLGAPSFAPTKGGAFAAGDLCGSGKIVRPERSSDMRLLQENLSAAEVLIRNPRTIDVRVNHDDSS
jgi:hypothetical protein